ncbi:MAG: hypothetical protein ACLPYS_20005 [Vulcanimicrobiaceae bacterium]
MLGVVKRVGLSLNEEDTKRLAYLLAFLTYFTDDNLTTVEARLTSVEAGLAAMNARLASAGGSFLNLGKDSKKEL